MPHQTTIRTVSETLRSIFSQVDSWFDQPADLRQFKPGSGDWSINQVLEHITLTNRFLMLTLGKWVPIAQQRAERGDLIPETASDLQKLIVIGERGSFGWVRPEHMEPTNLHSSEEVRAILRRQLEECLDHLQKLEKGEGTLSQITMTVNNLGKIDLYQWMFFIAQHARRHLQQLSAIEQERRGVK